MRIIMDPKISWDLKTVFRIGFVVSFTHIIMLLIFM